MVVSMSASYGYWQGGQGYCVNPDPMYHCAPQTGTVTLTSLTGQPLASFSRTAPPLAAPPQFPNEVPANPPQPVCTQEPACDNCESQYRFAYLNCNQDETCIQQAVAAYQACTAPLAWDTWITVGGDVVNQAIDVSSLTQAGPNTVILQSSVTGTGTIASYPISVS